MSDPSIPQKRCTKCGSEHPATAEYFEPTHSNGNTLRADCRLCRREQNRRRRGVTKPAINLSRGDTRICTRCRKELPATLEFFLRKLDRRSGLTSHCRECLRTRQNEANKRRRSNPAYQELERQRAHEYRATHHEQCLAYYREYRQRVEVVARQQVYRTEYQQRPDVKVRRARKERERRLKAEVKVYISVYNVQYRHKHKDTEYYKQMKRAERDRRRAREVSAEGAYTGADVQRQLTSQRRKCWWCSKPVHDRYEVDHLIPLARGGTNDAGNIVISCASCNRSKGSRLPSEWNGRLF